MTGEMSYCDIRPGGEHHAWAEVIREAAIRLGRLTAWRVKLVTMRPFDVYQGPYAELEIRGEHAQLWSTEHLRVFYVDWHGGKMGNLDTLADWVREQCNTQK